MLFAGNFSYDASQTPADDKATEIAKIIGNWQQDLSEYTALVSDRFITATQINKSLVEGMEVSYAAELPPLLVTAN